MDNIRIELPSSEKSSTIQIMTLTGEVMVHKKMDIGLDNYNMSIHDLPPGMYIIKCYQGNETLSSKIVKQ